MMEHGGQGRRDGREDGSGGGEVREDSDGVRGTGLGRTGQEGQRWGDGRGVGREKRC